MIDPTQVAIVVEPNFGERLFELAGRMPVWVAQTEGNAVAIKQLFRRLRRTGKGSLTSFVIDPGTTAEAWTASVVDTLDEHHGPWSQGPPYRALEVIGTPLTPLLREICEEHGFRSFHATPAGFRATRPSSPNGE